MSDRADLPNNKSARDNKHFVEEIGKLLGKSCVSEVTEKH